MTARARPRHLDPIGRRDKNEVRGLGRASSAGIELALAVVGCLLLGWWVDGKLGTSPWLTLIGLIFGSFVGFRSLWQAAQAANELDEE